jgi:hypothetical protein
VAPKIVWIANQIAKFRITPTTAAVTRRALRSVDDVAQPLDEGRANKYPKEARVNVTQVASNPPKVPASRGDSDPGLR